MTDDRNYSIHAPKASGVVLSQSLHRDFTEFKTSSPPDVVGVVSSSSVRSLRKGATELARYFRREFHYDFVLFSEAAHGSHDKDRAFLYSHEPYLRSLRGFRVVPLIGCVSFRWRENDPPGYALQWVWLHPYYRGHGLLSRSWEYFKVRFGEFTVEEPLSSAMKHFLSKQSQTGKSSPIA